MYNKLNKKPNLEREKVNNSVPILIFLFVYKKGGLSEFFCTIYIIQVILRHQITH